MLDSKRPPFPAQNLFAFAILKSILLSNATTLPIVLEGNHIGLQAEELNLKQKVSSSIFGISS